MFEEQLRNEYEALETLSQALRASSGRNVLNSYRTRSNSLVTASPEIKFIFITKMIDAVDKAFKMGLDSDDFTRE